MIQQSLGECLRSAAVEYAARPALSAKNTLVNYRAFVGAAELLAEQLRSAGSPHPRVLIFAQRTRVAYTAIVGALLADMAYVPLNPRFPIERNRLIALSADADLLVCDRRSLDKIKQDPDAVWSGLAVYCLSFDGEDPVLGLVWDKRTRASTAREPAGDPLAYLMFTSGTTGKPKGVPVSQRNVASYLATVRSLVNPQPSDRFVQLVDLTFDLSVHDMLLCWTSGACLYSVPEGATLLADRFAIEHELTMWHSVPSTAAMIKHTTGLPAGSLPSLRVSIFCGETLPNSVARDWQSAACNCELYNFYGPTEATIACTGYRWRADKDVGPGAVPLGNPFAGLRAIAVDEGSKVTRPGELGELCLQGTQVVSGYWGADDLTRERFVAIPDEDGRWYRTGDIVDYVPGTGFNFRGRVDRQIKVRGYRVELQEIESCIRDASGSTMVAVIPWPVSESEGVMGLVAFVAPTPVSAHEILTACGRTLAPYMVPHRVIITDDFPFNANGKLDLQALANSPLLGVAV